MKKVNWKKVGKNVLGVLGGIAATFVIVDCVQRLKPKEEEDAIYLFSPVTEEAYDDVITAFENERDKRFGLPKEENEEIVMEEE